MGQTDGTYSQPNNSGQCAWRGRMSLPPVGIQLQNTRGPRGASGVASSLKDNDLLEGGAQLDSGCA